MNFGIIAAGEGSRMMNEGVGVPKPLVTLQGETMLARLVRNFHRVGAEQICVIVNSLYPELSKYVQALQAEHPEYKINLTVKSTPSSMHSFYELSKQFGEAPFCVTTVDTVFREEEFKEYIEDFLSSKVDGLMAVTDYIDDESPLYVSTDNDMNIVAFNDAFNGKDRYISGGIYCLNPCVLSTLSKCVEDGKSRMRNFQRALLSDGWKIKAYRFSKILDVDHASDIVKAENFLNNVCK